MFFFSWPYIIASQYMYVKFKKNEPIYSTVSFLLNTTGQANNELQPSLSYIKKKYLQPLWRIWETIGLKLVKGDSN